MRNRLHVGKAVAALNEEALVVFEQVRRSSHRIREAISPRVLEQLPRALLHVRGSQELAVGIGRHPPAVGGAIGTLDDDREDDHSAGRLRADELVPPGRLVVGKHLADRIVALAVTAQRLKGVVIGSSTDRTPSEVASSTAMSDDSLAASRSGSRRQTTRSGPSARTQMPATTPESTPPDLRRLPRLGRVA